MEKANNVIDIFKLFLDDMENIKENIMDVMNPMSKSDFVKEEEEKEKKFEMDFDFSKISNNVKLKINKKA